MRKKYYNIHIEHTHTVYAKRNTHRTVNKSTKKSTNKLKWKKASQDWNLLRLG